MYIYIHICVCVYIYNGMLHNYISNTLLYILARAQAMRLGVANDLAQRNAHQAAPQVL